MWVQSAYPFPDHVSCDTVDAGTVLQYRTATLPGLLSRLQALEEERLLVMKLHLSVIGRLYEEVPYM